MTDEDIELTHGIVVAVNHLGHFLIEWPPRGRRKKWQREHETEADRMGVELAARAGYDPRAAVTLWNKMGGQSAGAPPQWLSTHPSHATRQKDLAEYAARVMPLYQGVRRCWRFGQTRPVTVDIVTTEGDGEVLKNLKRKANKADDMFSRLVAEMNSAMRVEAIDNMTQQIKVPSWL